PGADDDENRLPGRDCIAYEGGCALEETFFAGIEEGFVTEEAFGPWRPGEQGGAHGARRPGSGKVLVSLGVLNRPISPRFPNQSISSLVREALVFLSSRRRHGDRVS